MLSVIVLLDRDVYLVSAVLWKQNIGARVGSKGRKQLFKSSLQESPPEIPPAPSVLATFASKPLMMNGESASKISTPSGVCLQKVVYNSCCCSPL